MNRLFDAPGRHAAQRRAQHVDPCGDDGCLLGGAPARGRRVVDHVRARDGRPGPFGAGAGDLPRRLGGDRPACGPRDGSARAPPGRRGRLPVRRGGLWPGGAGDQCRLGDGAHPRLPDDRSGERDRAADPDGGRRHVPARAARPRHLIRALRVGVRRDPRPGGVRAAVRGPRARCRGAHRPVAGCGRDQPPGARARATRAARSEAHRGGDRGRPMASRRDRPRRRSWRSSFAPASGLPCSPGWRASA